MMTSSVFYIEPSHVLYIWQVLHPRALLTIMAQWFK